MYILDASQSAQCVLPGTRERIAWIEPVSTELLSRDLDLLLSFPCNRPNKLYYILMSQIQNISCDLITRKLSNKCFIEVKE